MRYNKEIEEKLKEKGIEWNYHDEIATDYYEEGQDVYIKENKFDLTKGTHGEDTYGYYPASKAELASALRDIFKISLSARKVEWYAYGNDYRGLGAYDKDADEATLKVVEKITEGK